MRFRPAAALTLAAAVLAGPLVVPAAPAEAATSGIVAPGEIGYDVSFPQCERDGDDWTAELARPLPAEPAFVIVGVNEGLGNTNNSCFAAELRWAQTATAVTSQPRIGLYVNTQNPGRHASWWPTGDATQLGTPLRNPLGTCTAGSYGAACAWVYGYSMAEADVTPAVRNVAVPQAYTWWLDVETSNDWSDDRRANRAVLEGMVAAFGVAGAEVGLYSTHQQWDEIIGAVPAGSPLTPLPSWLSAAVTERGAAENCTRRPLTRGPVLLAQWTDGVLDYNLACRRFESARTPTVSGAAHPGARLTAHPGAWSDGGVDFTYRWLRDGRVIPGATTKSYALQGADAGARISVQVTGTRLAYATTRRTSSAVRVHDPRTPEPALQPTSVAPRTAAPGSASRIDRSSPAPMLPSTVLTLPAPIVPPSIAATVPAPLPGPTASGRIVAFRSLVR